MAKTQSFKLSGVVREAFAIAKKARKNSYAPYSSFRVGAGLITRDEEIVQGCNVENASYGGAICAERVAILKAVSSGVTKFSGIVVSTDVEVPAFPCALCLQTMAEFFDPDTMIYVADTKRVHSAHRFAELLPHPFGPKQLRPRGQKKSRA